MAVRDPAYPIQAAVYAALVASPDMIAAFGGPPRIYDTVPLASDGSVDTGKFPYCVIGDDEILPGQINDNTDVSEIFVKVDVWSRPQVVVDNSEVKLIGGAVRAALDRSIDIAGHGVITHAFHGARYMRQPDRITRLGVVTILYQTAPIGLSPANA
jgi:hypothetical protein